MGEGAAETPASAAEARAAAVEALLEGRHLQAGGLSSSPLVRLVYEEVVRGGPAGPQARALLHTRYHTVPKTTDRLSIKW